MRNSTLKAALTALGLIVLIKAVAKRVPALAPVAAWL